MKLNIKYPYRLFYSVMFIVLFCIFTIPHCNVKSGYEDSKKFCKDNKKQLLEISSVFIKLESVSFVSAKEIKDKHGKIIDIEGLEPDTQAIVRELRVFLERNELLQIKRSNNSAIILFYLGLMDGVAYMPSPSKEFYIEKAFGKFVNIEEQFYYFVDKTI